MPHPGAALLFVLMSRIGHWKKNGPKKRSGISGHSKTRVRIIKRACQKGSLKNMSGVRQACIIGGSKQTVSLETLATDKAEKQTYRFFEQKREPMSAPIVSVVIPAYRSGVLLREAVESVMVQTLRDFEIILVDNNADEETKRVISQISKDCRGKVRTFHRPFCCSSSGPGTGRRRCPDFWSVIGTGRWRATSILTLRPSMSWNGTGSGESSRTFSRGSKVMWVLDTSRPAKAIPTPTGS